MLEIEVKWVRGGMGARLSDHTSGSAMSRDIA